MSVAGNRSVCVHGHFYQPPRENPWTDMVEMQESAAPFHDWNERITAECYAPNLAARRLMEADPAIRLSNNFERMSFNVGPTLMSWLEQHHPSLHAQIVLADRASERRLGHGNAMAQVYGHCIMPLASRRDQSTQVKWGISDFRYRFGREPEGMWLPETAADRTTLETLAEHGITFTILAPGQAARVRIHGGGWVHVDAASLDTTLPYRCRLRNGRHITIFFYDGRLAHDVAFGGLLHDGVRFGHRLLEFDRSQRGRRLVHLATDGESYGHHHRFGEMALAAALDVLAEDSRVKLTNYAAYLAEVDVTHEVELHENTSWSCAHGVERWRSDCGCNSGGHAEWNQAWRGPLREALEWLQETADAVFEQRGSGIFRDPWAARDSCIELYLRRHQRYLAASYREQFLAEHVRGETVDSATGWKLLELQRFVLLSFTSCGWFFDDCAGLETLQILTYAAAALERLSELDRPVEREFLARLERFHSNLPGHPSGKDLYQQMVLPRRHREQATVFAGP